MSDVLRAALIVVGAMPLLVAALAALGAPAPWFGVLDAWFAVHCHRDPSRTLDVLGQRLPVCARCTGIYLGLLLGGLLPFRGGRGRVPLYLLAAGAALLLLDVGTEALGWRVPSLATRLALGFAFAFPAALAVMRLPARTQG